MCARQSRKKKTVYSPHARNAVIRKPASWFPVGCLSAPAEDHHLILQAVDPIQAQGAAVKNAKSINSDHRFSDRLLSGDAWRLAGSLGMVEIQDDRFIWRSGRGEILWYFWPRLPEPSARRQITGCKDQWGDIKHGWKIFNDLDPKENRVVGYFGKLIIETYQDY